MKLNRFKQLLEAQMGNVKPLINEAELGTQNKDFTGWIIKSVTFPNYDSGLNFMDESYITLSNPKDNTEVETFYHGEGGARGTGEDANKTWGLQGCNPPLGSDAPSLRKQIEKSGKENFVDKEARALFGFNNCYAAIKYNDQSYTCGEITGCKSGNAKIER